MSHPKSHRNTLQRQVILEELRKLKNHPTASALHVLVQKRLPKISLGTIYRNLEYLSQIGAIQKLSISGGEARFDAVIEPHQHVRCINCGRVDDADCPPLIIPQDYPQDMRGYQILGHRLEFFGICPECRQSAAEPDEGADSPL
ncbi:MAG: transcriptional repressor [Pirellulales bacterium]|nr:transcriptional repressor [Pirellulales bacterium]